MAGSPPSSAKLLILAEDPTGSTALVLARYSDTLELEHTPEGLAFVICCGAPGYKEAGLVVGSEDIADLHFS